MPGQAVTETWDGIVRHFDQPSCYTPVIPTAGEQLAARACWQYPSTSNQVCADQTFTYASSREVTLQTAPTAFAAFPWPMYLQNQTGGPIEISTEHCGVPAWFQLDMGDELSASLVCPCACNANFEPDNCGSCGACADDVVTTLGVGETTSFTWDGRFWYTRPSGCSNHYDIPQGYEVHAKVCWGKPGASETSCLPIAFTLGTVSRAYIFYAM
jgi:hypothetical protein